MALARSGARCLALKAFVPLLARCARQAASRIVCQRILAIVLVERGVEHGAVTRSVLLARHKSPGFALQKPSANQLAQSGAKILTACFIVPIPARLAMKTNCTIALTSLLVMVLGGNGVENFVLQNAVLVLQITRLAVQRRVSALLLECSGAVTRLRVIVHNLAKFAIRKI